MSCGNGDLVSRVERLERAFLYAAQHQFHPVNGDCLKRAQQMICHCDEQGQEIPSDQEIGYNGKPVDASDTRLDARRIKRLRFLDMRPDE